MVIRIEQPLLTSELGGLQRLVRIWDMASRCVRQACVLSKLPDRADVALRTFAALATVAALGREFRMQLEWQPGSLDVELLLELVGPNEADIAPRSDVVRIYRELHVAHITRS